jgi:hypothetical protein
MFSLQRDSAIATRDSRARALISRRAWQLHFDLLLTSGELDFAVVERVGARFTTKRRRALSGTAGRIMPTYSENGRMVDLGSAIGPILPLIAGSAA